MLEEVNIKPFGCSVGELDTHTLCWQWVYGNEGSNESSHFHNALLWLFFLLKMPIHFSFHSDVRSIQSSTKLCNCGVPLVCPRGSANKSLKRSTPPTSGTKTLRNLAIFAGKVSGILESSGRKKSEMSGRRQEVRESMNESQLGKLTLSRELRLEFLSLCK